MKSKVDGKIVYVLLEGLSDDQKRRIEEAGPGAKYVYAKRATVSIEDLHTANIIIGNGGAEKVAGSPNLEFMQTQSAGVENYCKPGVLADDVVFCNSSGTFGPGIAEYMLAQTFMHCRKLHLYRDDQRAHKWEPEGKAIEIFNSTVLVLGTGDIGMNYAKRVKQLGAYVIGVRRSQKPNDSEWLDEVYSQDELGDVIHRADIIAMSMPDTPQTRGMMNADMFARCKKGVIIVNAGRGGAIVTEALMEALDKGIVGGAGLDVFEQEPLPADHKLWDYRNVTMTPHNTGGSDWFDRGVELMISNYKKYVNDEPLQPVDLKTGYKKSR